MQFKRPLLLAITGADGSGKSLLCQRLAHFIQHDYSLTARIASIWDVKDDLPGLEYKNLQKCFSSLNPVAASLAMFYAIHHALELAERTSPDIILYDAYCYKYAVTCLVRGVDYKFIKNLIASLALPDRTFYLKSSPETAKQRKRVLSPYETSHGNVSLDSATRFLMSQDQGQKYWQKLALDCGPWISIDAEQSEDEVFDQVLGEVKELVSHTVSFQAALC